MYVCDEMQDQGEETNMLKLTQKIYGQDTFRLIYETLQNMHKWNKLAVK